MTLILDASVLLKWFINEQRTEAALELKHRYLDGDVAIVIPALALYEMLLCRKANGCWQKCLALV